MIFKMISWLNFLSYGNTETVINLTNNQLNLIVGENGSGKSVLIDAFHYVLFGRPYRKIKIGELVNRVNKKKMLVTLEFEKGNNSYVIKRGIKPNIFSIEKNGESILTQNINSQQEDFEKNILGFDEKTFSQIVLMGSDYHTPFLRLTLPQRRLIIEQLFDLDIFPVMLNITKEKEKEVNKRIESIINEKNILNGKIEVMKRQEKESIEHNKRVEEQRKERIESLKREIESNNKKIDELNIEFNSIMSYDEIEKKMNSYKIDIDKITGDIGSIEEKKRSVRYSIENKYLLENIGNNNRLKELENEEIRKKSDIGNKTTNKLNSITNIERKYEQERFRLRTKIDNQNKIIKECNDKLEFYNKNDVCEVCGSILKGDKIDQIKLDNVEKIEESKSIVDNTRFELEDQRKEKEKELDELEKNVSDEIDLIRVGIKGIESERATLIECLNNSNSKKDKELESDINKLDSECKEKKFSLEVVNKKYEELYEHLNKKRKIEDSIKSLNSDNVQKQKNIDVVDSFFPLIDISKIQKELKDFEVKIKDLNKENDKFSFILRYLSIMIKMFSDSGIKTLVIGKYISILNQKMKEFLSSFGCEYTLEFDNQFESKIYIRKGEEVDYENFSGGERQRIDLAVLFTFMSFSRLKSKVSTNMLIFDEILDSSLDEEGIEVLFDLLKKMSINSSSVIYIISHRTTNLNRFDNILKIEKDVFSRIGCKKCA